MPSLRKHPRSPYWIACFTLPTGVRTNRSTGTTDKRKALKVAMEFESAAIEARAGRLTESRARKTLSDIYEMVNSERLPGSTIAEFFHKWLKGKELEAGEKTQTRYRVTVLQFLSFLGPRATLDISHLAARDVVGFRDHVAVRVGAGTVNIGLKILRAALNSAKQDGFVDDNVACRARFAEVTTSPTRRSFKPDELKKVLAVADHEWRAMILVAVYTGLRLGDICNLTWEKVDLEKGIIELVAEKTNKEIEVPIADALRPTLEALPRPRSASRPLFPTAHADYGRSYYNGLLSKRFYGLLVKAGLAERRKNIETGKGHSVKHRTSKLSFHSLRHNFVSLLKDAGVSDAIARDLAGHDSPVVNRRYSHLDPKTRRDAINKIPSFIENVST